MRCVKCATEITAWKCPQCGFDHTKEKIYFLSKPVPKDLQITEPNSAQSKNAEALVNVLGNVRNQKINEKTTVTPDSRFEIFDGKVLRKYHGSGEKVVVPSNITHIAQGAFRGNRYCMSIELPDGLESIGSVAFEGCTALESIHLPYGLREIGIQAFSGCGSLKQIQIPGTVVMILPSAFSKCTSLESVTFQNGGRNVDADIFSGCTSLKDIFVPDSVQEMKAARGGRLAQRIRIHASEKWIREHNDFFRENPNYFPVQNNENVNALVNVLGSIEAKKKQASPLEPVAAEFETEGTVLLKYKGNKEHVVIPAGITEIGKLAFSNNKTLRSVQLPDSLRTLETWAFDGCRNLEHIEFPPHVETLGTWAFGRCEKLERVILPSALSELPDWVFSGCKNLKEVVVQPGTRKLSLDAFQDCDSLQRIRIPDSVEELELFFWKLNHSIQIEASSDWFLKHRYFFENNPNLIPIVSAPAVQMRPEEWYHRGLSSDERDDILDAVRWYQLAAERGHSDAQNRLGRILDNGRGVMNQDPVQAVYWYQKAAEQGHTSAQYNLAGCYEEGRGVSRNPERAFLYYRLAAESGDTYAQRKLSYCYENGFGVKKDLSQAILWLERACGNKADSHLSELRARSRSLFPWRR